MRLSAVIITFNEERNILRCLDSLHSLADEIIVVDAHSTDRTPILCQEAGVRFFSRPWDGYSSAKNFGLAQVSSDHVLSLDADEALSVELQQSIRHWKDQNQNDGIDAFTINRLTQYCGHWVRFCGWYPDRKVRLWKAGSAYWEGLHLHESLVFSSPPKIRHLKGDILHFCFPTLSSHLKKVELYSEIASQEYVKKKKRIVPIYHYVMAPLYTFIRKYIFQLGLLDGFAGFSICVLSTVSVFLKYAKAKALQSRQ